MAFIKLDRAIIDSYCFANPNHLKVWLWLLIKANFKKTYVPFTSGAGITTIELQRGQMIFGRFTAEEELDMNGSMIYRSLKKFEELEQIKIDANNKFSIITICNYDSYQDNTSEDEQQVNNKRTTDEQLVNTLKEGKEGKEVFNNIIGKKFVFEDFNGLPNHLNKSIIEQTKITKQIDVTSDQVNSMWDVFKLQNLTGTKFYHNEHSVYQHFVNWIKNQNFNNGTNSKSISKSTTKNRTTADERFEFYTNYASQFSDGSNEIKKD